MGTYYKNNKTVSSDAVFYFKKYFWVPVVIFFMIWFVPFIKRMIDRISARNESNQNNIETTKVENEVQNQVKVNNSQNQVQSPVITNTKKTEVMKRFPKISAGRWNDIFTGAQAIAAALQTNPSNLWTNSLFGLSWESNSLTGYSEDEASAVKELKKFSGTFDALADAYYSLYTNSRNLKADCYKYLSKSDLEDVRKKHLPYKNL